MAYCLGCNVLMVNSTKGEYCHLCWDAIRLDGADRRIPQPKRQTEVDEQHWRPVKRDRMPLMSFGRRKPKVYRRPV